MEPVNKDDIKGLLNSFVVLDTDGILSTDPETTELEQDFLTDEDDDRDTIDNDIFISGSSIDTKLPENLEVSENVAPKVKESVTSDAFYADYCSKYLHFTDTNPTTYHAIDYFSRLLESLNYRYLSEKEPMKFNAEGGLYFSSRDQQSLIALIVGGKWEPKNGFGIVGSHVDALTAKLKPTSLKSPVSGYELLGVAPYSGALNHLWLDRDLGIAGRVLIRDATTRSISAKLVSSGLHAICRIPTLAPHFGATAQKPYNKETKMVPVMAFGADDEPATKEELASPLYGKHSLILLRYVANLAGTSVANLVALDLDLYDVQAAVRGGIKNDFMFAPRIDDRLCSYSAIHGLLEFSSTLDLANYSGCSIVYLANNEEIGSATRTGARGKFLNSAIESLITSLGHSQTEVKVAFANSIILSADVTHLLNPNFTSAYLTNHFPLPNIGLTLKKDANGHVMTDLIGIAMMEAVAAKNELTLQQFHIRNDMPSGGTIGPMLAVDTGARVIDVGLAQLSMHSIRAAAGYKEVGIGVETFKAFFKDWRLELDLIDYL
ncbi:CIC11C00000000885 [Sungouiella intermedia]|uniref:CIC11C00000000885 n=1 Tax=Sungouiella intermedia TaxID=45354 RepID=A0A1L0BKI3_9ASCO|nr:CIC11C00000000885 [[Candida] intermedia]